MSEGMPRLTNQSNAFLSGVFAALASASGKLALNREEFLLKICGLSSDQLSLTQYEEYCQQFGFVAQCLAGVMIFVCNALMWTFLSKAMNDSSTTGEAVALSSAFNFILTSILGIMFFHEKITLNWFIGLTVSLIGLVCINLSVNRVKEEIPGKQD